MDIHFIGQSGESKVCKYLKKHGFKVVERNYHSRFGEIDIIAENKEYLVFVEVKARNENSIARPLEFVDGAKQNKIIKTAGAYLSSNETDKQPRFDVAEVFTDTGEINYIENAFDA